MYIIYTLKNTIFLSKQWMRRLQIIDYYIATAFMHWKYMYMEEQYLINYLITNDIKRNYVCTGMLEDQPVPGSLSSAYLDDKRDKEYRAWERGFWSFPV